jgi:predicted nucleic acid-binding protein
MSFLVDTDICSAHLKDSPAVSSRFLQNTGRLHVSAVSLGELYVFAFRKRASPQILAGLLQMLNDLRVLDVGSDVARRFGRLRAELLDRGRPVASMDVLIAATALVHDLTLVTHNLRDYSDIPGLRVVDWTAA